MIEITVTDGPASDEGGFTFTEQDGMTFTPEHPPRDYMATYEYKGVEYSFCFMAYRELRVNRADYIVRVIMQLDGREGRSLARIISVSDDHE